MRNHKQSKDGIEVAILFECQVTQLTMRSFHESGAAQLTISKELKEFVKNHLIDIRFEDDKNYVVLVFDTQDMISGFEEYNNYQITTGNEVFFINTLDTKQNNDPIEALRNVKNILRVGKKSVLQPDEYYHSLMKQVLTVGTPYSGFVELLLTNMFLADDKANLLWRYNKHLPIKCKLGDKTLASKTSPLLNLLYQQNLKTISDIEFLDSYIDSDKLTIYEKIFLEKF